MANIIGAGNMSPYLDQQHGIIKPKYKVNNKLYHKVLT